MERLECRGRIGEGRAGLARGVSAAHVPLRRVPSLRGSRAAGRTGGGSSALIDRST
jgi:hypothetical protein